MKGAFGLCPIRPRRGGCSMPEAFHCTAPAARLRWAVLWSLLYSRRAWLVRSRDATRRQEKKAFLLLSRTRSSRRRFEPTELPLLLACVSCVMVTRASRIQNPSISVPGWASKTAKISPRGWLVRRMDTQCTPYGGVNLARRVSAAASSGCGPFHVEARDLAR